ncbi:MAG: hypothetical protein BWY66_00531 [bacterium ADurb.Bin374]|nr:MAG: hypothetical protein BWY66_00531 [bacterium ADurb.Bin374]
MFASSSCARLLRSWTIAVRRASRYTDDTPSRSAPPAVAVRPNSTMTRGRIGRGGRLDSVMAANSTRVTDRRRPTNGISGPGLGTVAQPNRTNRRSRSRVANSLLPCVNDSDSRSRHKVSRQETGIGRGRSGSRPNVSMTPNLYRGPALLWIFAAAEAASRSMASVDVSTTSRRITGSLGLVRVRRPKTPTRRFW